MPSTLLIITKNYPPLICGVGDHSYVLKQQLEQRGWQVSILTQTQQQKEMVWSLLDTQQNVLIPLNHNVAVAVSQAAKQLNQKPTLLWQYAPNSFGKKGIPFYMAFVFLGLRLKGYTQSIFFHEVAVRTWGYGILQSIQSLLQKIIANKLNIFSIRSATSIGLYQSYFWLRKPALIPVGSNLPTVNECPILLPERAVHFFCFTNRCTPDLLLSLSRIHTIQPDKTVLHLAGAVAPAQLAELQQSIQQYAANLIVRLHGTMSNADLANLLKACTIVLQPQPLTPNGHGGISAKNGTIAAAMQAGKPIITMTGDMTESPYFVHGESCWLLPNGEAEGWLQAVSLLLDNNEVQAKLRQGALDVYTKYMSPEVLSDAWVKFLQKP